MEDLALDYVKKIEETDEFKRLIELKDLINMQYAKEIIAFKTKEAEYLEARERPEFFDLEHAKKAFIEAKTKLYSIDLVKEYFKIEAKINSMLEEDMNSLKESISNKFKKYHTIKL